MQATLLKQNILERISKILVHHLYFSSPILYSFVHKIVFFLLSLYAQGYSTTFQWMLHSSWFCVFLLREYLFHNLWGIYWFHNYSTIWSKNVIIVWTKSKLIWIWKIFSKSTKFKSQDNFQRIRWKIYSLFLILWIIQLKKTELYTYQHTWFSDSRRNRELVF